MAVNAVGVTKQTAERMLLDAGAIYKNLTYDDIIFFITNPGGENPTLHKREGE